MAATYVNTKLKQGVPRIHPGVFFGHEKAEYVSEDPTPEVLEKKLKGTFKAIALATGSLPKKTQKKS